MAATFLLVGINIYRPLRDVARNEIDSYIEFCGFGNLVNVPDKEAAKPTPTVKQTIDDVIGDYFNDVSNSHLVANVVKTAARLRKLDEEQRLLEVGACDVCGLPMDEDPKSNWKRNLEAKGHVPRKLQNGDDSTNIDEDIWSMVPLTNTLGETEGDLKKSRCYGCRRTTLGAGVLDLPLMKR